MSRQIPPYAPSQNRNAAPRPRRRPARTRRVCRLGLAIAFLLAAFSYAQAQGESCDSCDSTEKIGFQVSGCSGNDTYDVIFYDPDGDDGSVSTTGSGSCTAESWSSTEKKYMDVRPDKTYHLDILGVRLCALHVNFFKVPEGYTLEINGKETTTIDWSLSIGDNERAPGLNDSWDVVLRKKCPCNEVGAGESSMQLNRVLWQLGLGVMSDGRSAQSISLREKVLTAESYTPAALIYSPPALSTEVDVVYSSTDESLRQVKAPEGLADVVVISANEYDVRFYRPADVGAKTNGVYAVSGQPYVTWKVKNPNPPALSRLQISKTQNGVTETSEYNWDSYNDAWSLTTGGGARVETKTTVYPTTHSRTETAVVKDNAGQLVSKVSRTYNTFDWGEELVRQVVDPDGAELTTTYAFYQNPAEANRYGRLSSVTNPEGSWEKYDYDASGNRTMVLRPWKDLSMASATEANSRVTYYTYSNYDGFEVSLHAKLVSSVVEKVAGAVVRKTTYARSGVTVNGEPAVAEVRTDFASDSSAQATTTVTYHSSASAFLANRAASNEYPDGRKDTYAYEKGNYAPNADPSLSQFSPDANGQAEREAVTHGSVASPGGVAHKSTREVTVRDQYGHMVLSETYAFDGAAYERVAWSVMDYDDRGHVVRTRRNNGSVTTSTWSGDQKTSEIDDAGVETAYTYDALNRVKTQTRKGVAAGGTFPAQADIVTTYNYDAEGRQSGQTVAGGGLSLVKSMTYDMAGRVKTETDEAGLVTAHAYSNGGRTETLTMPGGATRVTDNYLDGQARSVTGTAGVAQFLDYGVNADGTHYSQTFAGAGGLASPRWTKKTSDWLGRAVKTESPSFAGGTLVQTHSYNNKGQLQSESALSGTDRLLADRLYEYDEMGEQVRVGSDLDANGALAPLSTDRISETDASYQKIGGDWFMVTTVKTYLANNSDAPTVQTMKQRLTNFTTGAAGQVVSQETATDVAGNDTVKTKSVDRAAKKVTVTTDTPDSATDSVSVSVNGLLQSFAPTTPQSATTYAYDALGRQTGVTDPRTGTATKAYSAATGQLLSTSDAVQTTTYEYYPSTHTSAGRLKAQTNAAGKKVYFNYSSRGELTQTWGDTIYPLEYVYDAYGQKTELHTFRGGQNWGAAAWPSSLTGSADVTRWFYQDSTGLLTQKQDAAAKQVTYTYDALGRVSTRTRARSAAGGGALSSAYAYDPQTGELSGVDYSDSTPDLTFAYDRGGRQSNVTDAAGTHARTFNAGGELQTDQISGGILDSVQLSVGYDQYLRRQSLQSSLGANVLASQTYGYDAASRLGSVTSGARSAAFAYYPATGQLNTTTFGGGVQIARGFDSLGRLQSIATTTPAAGTVAGYTYTYNNLHQRTRATREDGSYWSYAYDDRGELTSGKKYWADNSPVWGAQAEYTFDSIGNRASSKSGGNQLGQLRQSAYTANSLNQYAQRTVPGAFDVTGAANSGAAVSVNDQAAARKGDYFYKELAVNNAAAPAYAQVNVVGARQNFGPGGEDAVTQQGGRVFVAQAAESYAYDADGNLTQDGRWLYAWDAENRLVSMQAAANVPPEAKLKLEFAYDYMGRRVQKKVYVWNVAASAYQLASATRFVYDGWNLVAELDGGNNLVRGYVWGGGDLLLINAGGNTYQIGVDGNRNVVVSVKANTGAVSASYEYDPYGLTLKSVGESAASNPVKFSSQYEDAETGMIYYGYRYYNPQTGKWISRDPIAEAGGMNLYGFVRNDPVNGIDLLGLARESQIDDKNNPLTYSCNCGWIDWGHARPDAASGLWDSINRKWPRSASRAGYRVTMSEAAGININGYPIRKGVVGDYLVSDNLTNSEKESVALGIFKEVSEAFEESQGGFFQDGIMHSSFSEEDLVSNLIGFYIAIKGYTKPNIDAWCKVIRDTKTNHRIWREGGAPGKNRNWTPVFHEDVAKKVGCCTDQPQWPMQLEAIRQFAKGDYFEDWNFRLDDGFSTRGRNPAPSSPQDFWQDLPNPRPIP